MSQTYMEIIDKLLNLQSHDNENTRRAERNGMSRRRGSRQVQICHTPCSSAVTFSCFCRSSKNCCVSCLHVIQVSKPMLQGGTVLRILLHHWHDCPLTHPTQRLCDHISQDCTMSPQALELAFLGTGHDFAAPRGLAEARMCMCQTRRKGFSKGQLKERPCKPGVGKLRDSEFVWVTQSLSGFTGV